MIREAHYVYCITDGRWCKVGFSRSPEVRMGDLQGGNPNELSMLWTRVCVYPFAAAVEARLHKHLARAKRHLRREWFAITPEQGMKLLRLIDRPPRKTWHHPKMRRLGRWLAETPMTQVELGRRVGVAQATVSQWLHGVVSPTVGTLRRLSDTTGLSIDELLSDDRAAA